MQSADVLDRLGCRTQGLATSTQLRAAGVGPQALSRAVAAGHILRVGRGVYARAAPPALPRHLVTGNGVAAEWVLRVRAALLTVGGSATACGPTAAVLFGWALLVEPHAAVEVGVSHGRSATKVVGVHTVQRRTIARRRLSALPDTERLRVTSPMQTVLDCCRSLPFVEGVVLCDSALRSRLVDLAELKAAAARLPGLAGADLLRRVLAAADPRSGSVLETVFRLQMVAAGIAGFRTQVVVRDRGGRYVLRVDFCFPRHRLVVEVDGAAWHQDPARDRVRDNALAAAGWRVLRFTWAQVVHEPELVLHLLREALATADAPVHEVSLLAAA